MSSTESSESLNVTNAELTMILASLRLIQELRDGDIEGWSVYIRGMPHFELVEPLENLEIDFLCDRLNTRGPRQAVSQVNLDE